MKQEKPCIMIIRTARVRNNDLRALCSGIEEEMIPFEIRETADEGVERMSFVAAQRSKLGVGVGLTSQGAALAYEKLSPEKPLFFLQAGDVTEEKLQVLGANAARLVKGIAFKE